MKRCACFTQPDANTRDSLGEFKILTSMWHLFKDEPSKAEAVAKHFGLNNVEVNLSEENEQGMTYLKFNKLVRPLIVEANPGTAHTKINSLLGALWSDYKRKKGKDTPSSSHTPSPKAASKAKKQKNTSKSTKPTKQPVSAWKKTLKHYQLCTLCVTCCLYEKCIGSSLSEWRKVWILLISTKQALCYISN